MSIARNTTYNLVGMSVPLLVTIATVPIYLQVVGVERYGVIALCWLLLGYVGFLDLGLGPALAQKIAAGRRGSQANQSGLIWTGLWLSLAGGMVGGALVYFGAAFFFKDIAVMDAVLRDEVVEAIPLLALIVPIVMLSSVLSGVLHGHERFIALNLVVGSASILMSLLPLAAAHLGGPTVPMLIWGALFARLVGFGLLVGLLAKHDQLRPCWPCASLVRPLLTFGGWITLTVVITPFLMTIDRLAIGALLGAGAVAIYAIPYSLIIRLTSVSTSLGGALYPRFAAAQSEVPRRLMVQATSAIATATAPLMLLVLLLLEPFLRMWIGPDMARQSAPVGAILVLGSWMVSLGHPAQVFLQSSGRPEAVAKLFAAEALPYWGLILACTALFGFIGTAIAWAVRSVIHTALLYRLTELRIPLLHLAGLPTMILTVGVLISLSQEGYIRYTFATILLCGSAVWSVAYMPTSMRELFIRAGLMRLFYSRLSKSAE